MIQACPVCGEPSIPASGDKSSKILLIGEFPGDEELERGRCFVGPAGGVLRTELVKVGIDLNELRVCNLWVHKPNRDERCQKFGYDLVLEEAKGKKAILLIGSDVVETFTNYKVSKVTGLQVDSVFSCKTVFAIVNPAQVFQPGRGVGEVRLALEKWSKLLKKEKLI